MPLPCPVCGVSIRPMDVSTANALMRCCACQSIFVLKGDPQLLARARDVVEQEPPTPRRIIDRPESVSLDDRARRLTVPTRVRGTQAYVLAFLSSGFGAAAVFLIWKPILSQLVHSPARLWDELFGLGFMFIFGVAFTVIALFGLSEALTFLFGSRMVELGDDSIRVSLLRPLHWRKTEVHLEIQSLQQVFCYSLNISPFRNTTRIGYRVSAILNDGFRHVLVDRLSQSDEALFIEQWIESELRIPDRYVRGELER